MYLKYTGPKEQKQVWVGARTYIARPDAEFGGDKIFRGWDGDRNIPDEDAQAILNIQAAAPNPTIKKVSRGKALECDPSFRENVLGSPGLILQMLAQAGVDVEALLKKTVEDEAQPEPESDEPLEGLPIAKLRHMASELGLPANNRRTKAQLIADIQEQGQ